MEENEFERIGAVLDAGLDEVLHQDFPQMFSTKGERDAENSREY